MQHYREKGSGGEAGVRAWCMYLHLFIQKNARLRVADGQSRQWDRSCFPLGCTGPPSWNADRKVQTTYLLLHRPQYCIAPARLSSCGQMIVSGQETWKACRESKGRASRNFFGSITRPTAIYKAYMQSWFLHRNMVSSRCSLQDTNSH